ncbi:hypothetical protein CC2G_013115 [Coprinopsis cinerea AmutBmut pab1-1]|nr:hypothetical protein CC2G_013115 [Coprinopsis cinerea AmutBmut pab1-1]
MSARFARTLFQAGARRAQTTAPRRALGRRNMASEAHTPATKSDTPWIIGSALIFGPIIAYLVSPSARKNTHAVHNDKKEYPGLKKKSETAGSGEQHLKPVMMTDDEGKEENVAGSLALAEKSDVPKASDSPAGFEAAKAEAAGDESAPVQPDAAQEIGSTSPKSHHDSKGTFQDAADSEPSPTPMGKAREAALEHITPKEHAEQTSN